MADAAHEPVVGDIGIWRPLRGPFERWPHQTDLLLAVVSFALTLAMWTQSVLAMSSWQQVFAFLLAFVGNFALLWRRSHPVVVHGVILGASILLYLAPAADGIVALAFSLYSLGRYEADRRASVIGMIAALLFVVFDLWAFSAVGAGDVVAAAMVLALWYVGRRLRFRGEYLRLLEERARHVERERNAESERAVAAERTRIAREMHDVVAHQVSLMTVQAGAARTISSSDPQAAGDAMAAVEVAGRQALSEMRHLLGLLRPSSPDDALGPQPGIGDLPALVRNVRDVGPRVRLQTKGMLNGLPARLELNAYRIVQEALTNVVKHAGAGVDVDVAVDGRSDCVVITIRDNGDVSDDGNGGGHGIVGMRERVELLGGSFDAGRCAEGGFEVRAVLPLDSGWH